MSDDRPARRRFEERSRYSPDRRWGRRRSWSRSPRRNRSPLDSRGGGRLRSRSPRLRASRSPRGRSSRSPVRYRPLRSRTRSRSPRPRSWSRPGSGGVGRPKSRSLSLTRQPDSRGSTPLQDNDFISSSTNDAPAVSSTVSGLRPLEGKLGETNRIPGGIDSGSGVVGHVGTRARCQNFEEKGFCMLGDVCPYDHGADPVVVEDDTLALGRRGPTLEGPDFRLPPPGHLDVQLNLNRPPSAHVEPYFPENPSLQVPLRPFLRGPPPDLRHPPPGMLMNRPLGPDIFSLPKREVIMSRPPPGLSDRGMWGSENVDKFAKTALNRASHLGKLICWSDLKTESKCTHPHRFGKQIRILRRQTSSRK
ncbi:RNA-binding protein 26 [Plakobranchus ocellatus]|uniref:RNA-binding protein 26 n=1 Tax=Plakobranchus ocellatus TaxID=259542 RepID=A0AAV3YX46_9GAST|nr:RNA-binding protein 26 [Plakobranchus ocellatus]